MGKGLGIVERHVLPASLAALMPEPRVNLTRFHGVFAPICPLGATANTVRW
jgi:hypothetical protein